MENVGTNKYSFRSNFDSKKLHYFLLLNCLNLERNIKEEFIKKIALF